MRHRPAFVIASLRADMVERTAIGHVDLHALVEPRRCRAVLQHRQFRTFFDPDDVMQDRVRPSCSRCR